MDKKTKQTVLILGVPESIKVYYKTNSYNYDFGGTYVKDGWEVFGYPVYRIEGANKDNYLFYRNMEGYWCFVYDGKIHKSNCITSNAVKNGKFSFVPPQKGWMYTYNKQYSNKPETNMRVISHWWEELLFDAKINRLK